MYLGVFGILVNRMHCADVVLELVSVSVSLIGCSVWFFFFFSFLLLHCDGKSMEAHFCQNAERKQSKKSIFSITCDYSLKINPVQIFWVFFFFLVSILKIM